MQRKGQRWTLLTEGSLGWTVPAVSSAGLPTCVVRSSSGELLRDALLCTLKQALVVQKILDAIYASSESGREVRIR